MSVGSSRLRGSRLRAVVTAVACLAGGGAPAFASDYQGYVQSVVQVGSAVFIYVGNGWFGTDQCGSGRSALILSADSSTTTGRTFISLALTAKTTGNQVYAGGTGACYGGNTPNGGTSEPAAVLWLQ